MSEEIASIENLPSISQKSLQDLMITLVNSIKNLIQN